MPDTSSAYGAAEEIGKGSDSVFAFPPIASLSL